MLRFLGRADADVEAMVMASSSGCQLSVHTFQPSSSTPVGPLVQSVQLSCGGSEACIEVDTSSHDSLAVGFHDKAAILVLPLTRNWCRESRIAFSYAQRFAAEMPASQLTIMTATSYTLGGPSLFLYRTMNFTREKDGLPGCSVVVHEVLDAMTVSAEEGPMAAAPEALPVLDKEEPVKEPPPPGLPPPPEEPVKETPPPGLPRPPPGLAPASPRANGVETAEEPTTADEPTVEAEEEASGEDVEVAGPEQREECAEDADWSFLKHVAASFVRGLDKRRGELAEKIIGEVSEIVMKSGSGAGDTASLELALAKVREAKEAQAAGEKGLQAAVRKATDQWAETSAATVSSLLSKEFSKISDGVAATLAQQLAQSRKFCEALAKGVQKSSGLATRQALESMRPPKQLQETIGTALGEALHESLTPVFKAELRSHFEQELAPLIGQRVSEMMSSFRDRMSECLEGIATEQEQAAQRLAQDLGPVVAEELKQVERIIQQRSSMPTASGIPEAQLDELAKAVETEVVQPLKSRIKDLTAQVQALRQDALALEKRCAASAVETAATESPETEERLAMELEATFRSGKAEDAFSKAMRLQTDAKYQDFLARLCALVPEPDQWLSGDDVGTGESPLGMKAKMLLMLALAKQLTARHLDDTAFLTKVEWIQELWLAFDFSDKVEENAPKLCSQLVEVLDQVHSDAGAGTDQALRKLKRSLQQAAKMMARE